MKKQIVVSGVQATGSLHLGNYLGAIKWWLDMQKNYDCYFFLADLHAITVSQEPSDLREASLRTVATYLASGLNPDDVTIFAQSNVSAHSELAWLLNCVTPLGWLKRMTQFKDKAGKDQDMASCGLFTYPVLMAADILLYDANLVPVGEDQKQHLELTRDIAGAVNRKFNAEFFTIPEPLIQGSNIRVKSLKDGNKKMSKSDASDLSRINLTDSNEIIASKISKAKTDSLAFVSYDHINRPEIANLLNIYSEFSKNSIEQIVASYDGKGFAMFKKDLADLIITNIQPISDEFYKLMNNKDYLYKVLEKGKIKASDKADKKISSLKTLFGFN